MTALSASGSTTSSSAENGGEDPFTLKRGFDFGKRMLRSAERSSDMEPSSLYRFCQDCIIATRGYDLREGQGRWGLFKLGGYPLAGACQIK